MLRTAVRRLQRNAAVAQRGSDLHDGAMISGLHPIQRHSGAVDETEITHFGDSTELARLDLGEGGEYRREGDIDPDVDRTQCNFELGSRSVHLVEICDVNLNGKCLSTGLLDLVGGAVEAGSSSGH